MKMSLIIMALFSLSVLLRWYYLPHHLFFGFEQGRDAFITQNITQLKDFVLVGPKTDIDGVFHGAWYYYLMAIPYGLSGGNPLVASAFLVILSSLVPVLMFWFLKDVTKSWWWGGAAGVMTALSYEYITYARWLSNVTPAVLIIPAVYYCLWLYRQTKNQRWFLTAVTLAALAAQFQIILCILFMFVFGVLWISRWYPRPSLKTSLLSLVMVGVLFSPMILFNLRNEFISFKGSAQYFSTNQSQAAPSVIGVVTGYGKKIVRLIRTTFIPVSDWRVTLVALCLVAAATWMMIDKRHRPIAALFGVWSLMSLPVCFFPSSLGLTQLYIGSGLGMIGLITIALARLWQSRLGKVIAVGWLILFNSGLATMEYKLQSNQDVLFRTIQDDLNYQDQQDLLKYIHEDAAGQPYRLEAFTIPYFQPQGWQYLQKYWYPQDTADGAKQIYIVIEEKVDPFWQEKWLGELNVSHDSIEKKFGRLRVQKRKLL
jgi:hypothetical protein